MGWWARYIRATEDIEIVDGLWMGADPGSRGARSGARGGVTHVVDVRGDATCVTKLPTADVGTGGLRTVEYETAGIDELCLVGSHVAGLIRHGEVVFIRCRTDIQRSLLIACSALMQMGWSPPDAYEIVSSRHAAAAMADEQLTVLQQLKKLIDAGDCVEAAAEDGRQAARPTWG